MATINEPIQPDYAIHPGEILEETLEARGITKGDLAERTGMSPKTVSQIVNGKAPITPETAIALEKALGISAELWNNLDSHYRLFHARRMEKKQNESLASWAKEFPLAELRKRGALSTTNDAVKAGHELLAFFAVANAAAWGEVYERRLAYFRKSAAYEASVHSIAAWLRLAELEANKVETKPYNARTFERSLREIRKLTVEEPELFEPRMRSLCSESGVAFVLVSELPKCRTSGATRWIGRSKIMLALSLRYKTNDQFWFSFYHEAGHIQLHGRERVFVDSNAGDGDQLEVEANEFARELLLPGKSFEAFKARGEFRAEDIKAYAGEIGIAPGIVVGALQHDGIIEHGWHNELKRKLALINESG